MSYVVHVSNAQVKRAEFGERGDRCNLNFYTICDMVLSCRMHVFINRNRVNIFCRLSTMPEATNVTSCQRAEIIIAWIIRLYCIVLYYNN